MASKYAHLKGQVPEDQPTEREESIARYLEEYRIADTTTVAVAARYNGLERLKAKLAAETKVINQMLEAVEIIFRERLDGEGLDAVKADGYTWSVSYVPYPVCEDPALIEQYFLEHGMEDQLHLKASELASRLKNHVKEEAQNNELIIDIETDPVTGVEIKRTVRSQIPGVKVFLDASLSRTKSSTAKE